MKTRLAAAVVALGMLACQQDQDPADVPSAGTSGNADS